MSANNFEIFSIEGNIGSGKSTLFEELRKVYANNSSIIFLEEPVGLWEKIKNKQGETMLQLFYKNKSKDCTTSKNYAFQFQIMALSTRLAILKKAIEDNNIDKVNCFLKKVITAVLKAVI